MNKIRFYLFAVVVVLTLLSLPVRGQLLGVSLNPLVNTKLQFPVLSHPLKTGTGYSAKTFLTVHLLYFFRFGVGFGYHQFSHRHYLESTDPVGVSKVKTKWSNFSIPLKVSGVIPIKNELTPFFEYEANIILPQTITRVERYPNSRATKASNFIKGDIVERTFRLGGLFRNDERKHEFAGSAELSFMRDKANDLRYISIGLCFQYYFVLVQKRGLRD